MHLSIWPRELWVPGAPGCPGEPDTEPSPGLRASDQPARSTAHSAAREQAGSQEGLGAGVGGRQPLLEKLQQPRKMDARGILKSRRWPELSPCLLQVSGGLPAPERM